MRLRSTCSVLAMLGLMTAACTPEAEAPPAPVEAAPVPTAPPAPAIGYACESGMTVEVQYPDTATAQLKYKNQTYPLRTAPSASGARYAGSGLEWTTATRDGQESAILSRLGPNEDVGVAVLERCSRPVATTTPTGPQPLPMPAPGGVLPVALPCKGPQLKLSAEGGDAGAGNRVSIVGVQNVGSQACSLTGYPNVTLQDAQGRNLTTIRAEQTPGSYLRAGQAPAPVELAPQAKALVDLAWNVVPNEGNGQTSCPQAARVRMTMPGDTSVVTLTQTLTPCGGRVRISPFRAVAEPVPTP